MTFKRTAGTRWLTYPPDAVEQVALCSAPHLSMCALLWVSLSVCVSHLGVVYMAGKVYAVGGFNGSLRVRTVDVYDGLKDQWSSVPSMQERRSTLGAAVLGDLLYAVGGFDGSTGISLKNQSQDYSYTTSISFFLKK